jgi:CPA2 family monovalent cation:H+ antiporter-2
MEHAGHLPILREALVFLFAAGVLVPALRALGVPGALGFLAAGVAVGPFGVARLAEDLPFLAFVTVGDPAEVRAIGELGVIFLMFAIGLELPLRRLWTMRAAVAGYGGTQIALCGAAIGAVAAWQGLAAASILAVGVALAFSSTAMVMHILAERGQTGAPLGRFCFAILLAQDLAVVPMLVGLDLAAGGGGNPWIKVAIAIAATAAVLAAGRWLLRPLFARAAATRAREAFLAITLLTAVGAAAATGAAGLSPALGAFLAGVMLGESEYRHEVEIDIEPIRGLLMGLFFLSVGMGIDFKLLAEWPLAIPLAILGLIALKGAVVYALATRAGLPPARAAHAGLLLAPAGEFAFVVLGAATLAGALEPAIGAFLLLIASLTMAALPGLDAIGRRLRFGPARDTQAPVAAEGHTIVLGFGRIGRVIGRALDEQELPWIAVDADPGAVARDPKGRVLFGNAARAEMLRRAGADNAAVVVVTIDDPDAALRAARAVRQHWPNLPVLARARDGAHARGLRALAVEAPVPEAIEAGLALARQALDALGLPRETALHRIETRRADEFARAHAAPD